MLSQLTLLAVPQGQPAVAPTEIEPEPAAEAGEALVGLIEYAQPGDAVKRASMAS